jgi:N-hydroxyarylamine O-acetyltransferase
MPFQVAQSIQDDEMTIDVAAFLDRIGYRGPVEPTASALTGMHWAHLQSVPFENLDIRPLGRRISLDLADLEDKIFRRRRGGFCYELNGLLAEVLREIGFDVTIVSVQFIGFDPPSPPFDHMALLVRPPFAAGRYLADVGCGNGSPARPLQLDDGYAVHQPETGCSYRLDAGDGVWTLSIRRAGEEWKPEYTFDEMPRAQAEFLERCRFQDGSPDSHFTQGPLCSRNIPGGRITLTHSQLVVTRDGVRNETNLAGDSEFHTALREHFGIDLTRELEHR